MFFIFRCGVVGVGCYRDRDASRRLASGPSPIYRGGTPRRLA